MKRRILFLVFVGAQFASGFIAFGLWGIVSHSSDQSVFAQLQTALAVAMVIYLPISLGLPFLVANYARRRDEAGLRQYSFAVRAPLVTALAACAIAISIALLAPGELGGVSIALSTASAVSLSVLALQIARVNWSLAWLTVGTMLGIGLPLVSVMASTRILGQEVISVVAVSLAAISSIAAIYTLVLVRRFPWGLGTAAKRTLGLSLPLVPHLIVFGALTQGPRLTASIVGGDAELITQAAYVMQFMGIGFAALSSVHGVLAASLQSMPLSEFRLRSPRISWAYAGLGLVSSVAVVLALMSPLASVFRGFAALSSFELASIALTFGALSGYYFQSTCLVRGERTAVLAAFSVPTSVLYFSLGFVVSGLGGLMGIMALAFLTLHLLVGVYRVVAGDGDRRDLLKTMAVSFIGYLPAGVLLCVALGN
tara:strand:+ start:7208 stop:8482 length:1275 start_codon:yes stop_codon:yes gene_type:complete